MNTTANQISKLLEDLKRKDDQRKLNKSEGLSPQVGIYWIDYESSETTLDPLYLEDRDLALVDSMFIQSKVDHYSYWENLKNRNLLPKSMRDKEYEDISRGRVIYSREDDEYLILGRKEDLKDQEIVKLIIREFRLPRNKVVLRSDHHYEIFT